MSIDKVVSEIKSLLPPDIELVSHRELVVKGRYVFKFESDGIIKEMPLIVSEMPEERITELLSDWHLAYLIKRFREGLM